MSKKPNGINIQLTPCQFDYLYDVLMDAYANDIADQKDWDVQTFDNLCLLYTSPSPRDG